MIINDHEESRNFEVKTPSPLSSHADRSTNEEEENPGGSESSSDGSSPSDLKKLLQELPAPNEIARLTSRVVSLNRRLSRTRESHFRFQGASGRIEEREEQEEKEQRQRTFLSTEKPPGEGKSKDARARRRARIRLEVLRCENRAMVFSQPSAARCSQVREESRDAERTSRSANAEFETLSRDSGDRRFSIIETPRSYSQQCSPLSRKRPSALAPYRGQGRDVETSVARASSLSNPNSPKARIELQPLDVRPTKFGGYRPVSGVILQNLSSGSEGESCNGITSGRTTSVERTINPISVDSPIRFCDAINSPPVYSSRSNVRNSSSRGFNAPLESSRKFSAPSENSNSSRTTDFENLPQPRGKADESPSSIGRSNARNSKLFSNPLTIPRESFAYKLPDTPRSDRPRNPASLSGSWNNLSASVDESPAGSSRSGAYRYDEQVFSTPPISSRTSMPRDVFTCHLSTAQGNGIFGFLGRERSVCDTLVEENEQEYAGDLKDRLAIRSTREYIGNISYTKSDTKSASGRSLLEEQNSGEAPITLHDEDAQEDSSSIDREKLTRMESRYFVDREEDAKFPLSTRTIGKNIGEISPRFNDFASEGHTPDVVFNGESTGGYLESIFEKRSTRDNPEFPDELVELNASDNGIANVPVIALDSREMSYSTSAGSKNCSGNQLDADALFAALSNVSLRRNDISENNNDPSYRSKTISRPDSPDNSFTINESSRVSRSLKSDKYSEEYDVTKESQRSSIGRRSRIPVMIRENKNRGAEQFLEFEDGSSRRRMIDSITISIDSRGEPLQNVSPFSEESEFVSEMGCRFSRSQTSPEDSLSDKKFLPRFAESISSISGLSTRGNSKEQTKRSDAACTGNTTRNCSESESSHDRARFFSKDIRLEDCLSPLLVEKASSDDPADESNREAQSLTFRADSISRDDKKSREAESEFLVEDRSEHGIPITGNEYNTSVPEIVSSPEFPRERSDETQLELTSSISIHRETYDQTNDPCFEDDRESRSSEESASHGRFVSTDFLIDTSNSRELESHRPNRVESNYEGEIRENIVGESNRQFENEIGDTGCQEIPIDRSNEPRLALHFPREVFHLESSSLNSSPTIEGIVKKRKLNDDRDKVRFSLEKLVAEQFRRNMHAERSKTVLSESAPFLTETTREACVPVKHSSSTSKLHRARDLPRMKKKSQDRFPFTISEQTSAASVKFKMTADRGRQGTLDKNSRSLERTYKLDRHPSITRLAGEGFEDTPTDILNYVAYSERENRRIRLSGMKGFVQRFSARWGRSRKRSKEIKPDRETTSVIYENRDYRVDSLANSCSESSVVKAFNPRDKLSEDPCMASNSPEGRSCVISDQRSPKETDAKDTSPEYPRRKYDRDDLWVREFKEPDSNRREETEILDSRRKDTEDSPCKDPYSLFIVKSSCQAPRTSENLPPNEKRNAEDLEEMETQPVKLSDRSVPATSRKSRETVGDANDDDRDAENFGNNRNTETCCLCLSFLRMIARVSVGSMSRYRSPINEDATSVRSRRKLRYPLRKRKG